MSPAASLSDYPLLAQEWDDTRPLGSVLPTSKYQAKWKCSAGHQWLSQVRNRTQKNRPNLCPYCSGVRVYRAENSIPRDYPHLALEWADSADISAFSTGSHYKASWRCARGHSWLASIYARAGKGRGCPKCAKQVSAGELEVLEFVRVSFPRSLVRSSVRDVISPKELDIYLPEHRAAIEYNGTYWHSLKPSGYHEAKTLACRSLGIRLLHLDEEDWKNFRPEAERSIVEHIEGTSPH